MGEKRTFKLLRSQTPFLLEVLLSHTSSRINSVQKFEEALMPVHPAVIRANAKKAAITQTSVIPAHPAILRARTKQAEVENALPLINKESILAENQVSSAQPNALPKPISNPSFANDVTNCGNHTTVTANAHSAHPPSIPLRAAISHSRMPPSENDTSSLTTSVTSLTTSVTSMEDAARC